MTWIKRLIHLIKANSSLTIIITAAILIELMSIGQQIYTRKLLGDELEKRAESELTLKANYELAEDGREFVARSYLGLEAESGRS